MLSKKSARAPSVMPHVTVPAAVGTVACLLVIAVLGEVTRASADPVEVRIAAGSYSSKEIYHSPFASEPLRGYTSFTGSWIDRRDGGLVVAFGQATGPIPSPPNRDFSDLTNSLEYLRSGDAGASFAHMRSDRLVSTTGVGLAPLAASPQATIGLEDGTLIRRVNGEDICGVEPTVKCTAYLQRLVPATAEEPDPAWGQPQYLLDPEKATYQLSRIQRLRDGRLLATGQQWPAKAGERTGSAPAHALALVSSDQGRTWTSSLSFFSSEAYMYANEWDVAELPNEDLLAVFRSRTLTAPGAPPTSDTTQVRNQALLRANRDADGNVVGYTLTDVKPAAGLVHSGHPELLATKEGVVLHIAANPANNTSLIHYTNDNGATWKLLENATPRRGVYYPTSVQAADGTIHIFGHVGGDDDYGERDQSITMDSFRLSDGAPPPPPPPPDATAPAVTVTEPSANAVVSGTSVVLRATATDDVGVTSVQFRVDGENVGSRDTTSPYSVEWSTTDYADGPHSVSAVGEDGAGNRSTSAPVAVAVANDGRATLYRDAVMRTPGLLSYWRLGDAFGLTSAVDVASARHGTYVNGAALGAPGALTRDANTAVRFDGVNDYVALPTVPSSIDFTIEGWQKLDAGAPALNTLYGGSGAVRLMLGGSAYYAGVYLDGKEYVFQAGTPANTGVWVHWALVRTGASFVVYRNGVVVGGRSGLPAATSARLVGSIGRWASAYPAKATIDEVALYGAALSATEIQAHHAAR